MLWEWEWAAAPSASHKKVSPPIPRLIASPSANRRLCFHIQFLQREHLMSSASSTSRSSFSIVRAVHFPNIPAVGLVCKIVQIYWQTICTAPICPLFPFYGVLESVEINIKCKYSISCVFLFSKKKICVFLCKCMSVDLLFVCDKCLSLSFWMMEVW